MATIGAANACHVVVRAVGIARITLVGVLEDDIVVLDGHRQMETSFTVGHPNAEVGLAQAAKHHALVLRNVYAKESTLELMTYVVQHLSTVGVVGIDEAEFHHQLASVADTERQGVLAGVETFESGLRLRVVEERACPTLGRTKDIAVRESTAEDNHIDFVEGFAARNEVGHRDVLHVKACQVEGISHFALAVRTFLADNGGADAARSAAVGVNAKTGKAAVKVGGQVEANGLLLVVLEAFGSLSVERLLRIQFVGSMIPDVAHFVYVERQGAAVCL